MNTTTITEFILLGFSCSHTGQLFIFAFVVVCYTTILLGNFLIMVTVWSDSQLLQCPMYFFLSNLSLIDLCMGSISAPKLAADLLKGVGTIPYGACLVQVFCIHFLGCAEMLLLDLMAYDRYVAICHPLRYTTIMDRKRCVSLLIFCWFVALIHGTIQAVAFTQLSFCGLNVMDTFFCDIPQVIKLACSSDIYIVKILTVVSDSLTTVPSMLPLLISYTSIMASLHGRFGKGGRKALSTCSSHLTVLILFYLPTVFVYLNPASSSNQAGKMASVFYMVVTPALNPLIYSLRNQEMKSSMRKLQSKCKLLYLSQMSIFISCQRD